VSDKRMRRIDEIGAESRRRIMDAAEELFAERGYDRTSFVDIAERSGISRGSIPWHFENKEGLLIAVVERAVERYIPAESLTSFDAEGLRGVLEQVKKWARDPTASMLHMILIEALSPESSIHGQYVDFYRRRREGVARLLQASAKGRIPSEFDIDALAAAVNGALIGLHLQWRLDPSFDLDAGIDNLELMIERALNLERAKTTKTSSRRTRRGAASA
jgi:TetR/AcrR family acrAB operon transcriptional repressor